MRSDFLLLNNVVTRKCQTLSVIIRFLFDREGPQRPFRIGGVTWEKQRERCAVSVEQGLKRPVSTAVSPVVVLRTDPGL